MRYCRTLLLVWCWTMSCTPTPATPEDLEGEGEGEGDDGNRPPVAAARIVGSGPFLVGDPVHLDGGGSSDPDGDPLTFAWSQSSGPGVSLSATTTASTEFVAAVGDELAFTLTVSDGSETASTELVVPMSNWSGSTTAFEGHPFRTRLAVEAYDMAAIGDMLFVASGDAGVLAYDLTDPRAPVLLGAYVEAGWSARSVEVTGALAVAEDLRSIAPVPSGRLLNVFDPSAIVKVADIQHGGPAAEFDGTALYVAFPSYFGNLFAYDLSNPAAPIDRAVGSEVRFGANSLNVAVAGEALFVADEFGVTTLDTSADPIVETGAFPFPTIVDGPRSLEVVGNLAITSNGTDGVFWFDVTDPFAPVLASRWQDAPGIKLHVEGNRAYFAGALSGVAIADVSDIATPVTEAVYQTPGRADEILPVNGYAVVRDQQLGTTILDIEPCYAPLVPRVISLPGSATAVAALGDHALIGLSDGDSGLYVVDLTRGEVVASLPTDDVSAIRAVDTTAFVVDVGGIHVVDVSEPTQPEEVSDFAAYGIHEIAVSDGLAFLLRNSDIEVIDVSEPTELVEVGSVDAGSAAGGLVVGDGFVYLAHAYGLEIYDVGDPTTPALIVDERSLDGFDAALFGSHLVIPSEFDGTRIVDVRVPSAPVEVASLTLPGDGEQVYVGGARALVVENYGGVSGEGPFQEVYLVDLRSPAQAAVAGVVSLPSDIEDVVVDASRAILASGAFGVLILDVDPKVEDHGAAPAGSVLEYTATSAGFPVGALRDVACRVSGGSCATAATDQETWRVSWTLPALPGDYEIALVVGDVHGYTTAWDRVRVE